MVILSISLTGCFNDDDLGTNFFYELVAIEEVVVPEQFISGETYEIKISYFRPSTCHSFNGFDYERISNERTVSIVNVVIESDTCEIIDKKELIDTSLDFYAGKEDSYVFRFWQGKNEQGENQFLILEVPVVKQ